MLGQLTREAVTLLGAGAGDALMLAPIPMHALEQTAQDLKQHGGRPLKALIPDGYGVHGAGALAAPRASPPS